MKLPGLTSSSHVAPPLVTRGQSRRQLVASVAVFTLLAGTLVLGGLAVRRQAERTGLATAADTLAAIAEHKVELFSTWQSAQIAAGEALRTSGEFTNHVRKYLDTGEGALELESWLEAWVRGHGYRGAHLFDEAGTDRLHFGTVSPGAGAEFEGIRALVRDGRSALCTNPCAMGGDRRFFELFVPVGTSRRGEAVPIAMFVVDVETTLFPQLRAASNYDAEVEVRLIDASGEMLRLSGLPGAPQALPADPALGAEGAGGILFLDDVAGAPAIAAVRAVPETDWRIVVRIPRALILARVHGSLVRLGTLLALLISSAFVITVGFWFRQRSLLLEKIARSEMERSEAARTAEEALLANQERLLLALGAGNQGVYDLDLASGASTISPEYNTMLGFPASSSTNLETWRARIHPDDRERMEAIVAAAASGETGGYREEYRLLNAAGGWSWVITSGKVLVGEDGRPARLIGTHTDITLNKRIEADLLQTVDDLRAAEEKVRRTASEWTQTFDSVSDPIWLLDREYRIRRCNRAAIDMLGVSFSDIIGRRCWELLHGGGGPVDGCPCKRMFDTGDSTVQEFEVRERWYRVCIDPISGEDGSPAGAVHIMTDITERRHEERELESYRRNLQKLVGERTSQLETAVRDLERFAYSVSHDLRAPLRSIDGFAEALVEHSGPGLDDEGRRLLDVVRHSAQRMGHLIEDLLRFSRLGSQGLEPRHIDMAALANEICAELVPAPGAAPVSCEIGRMPPCWADPSLVRQVLANLIENAVKFSGGRELLRVEVGGSAEDGESRYFVRDEGCGFDMQYADRLFGVFQRLCGRDEYPGSGVGLAIVQSIVQRHGGRVGAEGAVGGGATFWFTLPACGSKEA